MADRTARAAIFPDLAEASVFVTGGGSGIGAALVGGFLAQGARVAFVDIADSAAFVEEMRARHGRAPLWVHADLRDVGALEAAVAEARAAHGPIGKLICNAAMDQRTRLGETSPEQWDDLHAVNIRHLYFAAQACLEDLKATSGAAIVNFTSTSFMQQVTDLQVYQAAKAAVIGLTRGQARDLGRFGVRANALAPGWVMTERQRRLWVAPGALEEHLRLQAIPQEITPEEMVGPCLFLASDASAAMTAQVLIADRGRV